MSISGGNDTKVEYPALLDPKLQTNTRSAAAIFDFMLQWSYTTDIQKAPSEVLKGMVCSVQIKSKTPFTSTLLRAYMAEPDQYNR